MDQAGNAYVTGWTSSTNFPTANAFQSTSGGQLDAFIAKIVDLSAPVPNLPQNSVVNGASFRLATDPNGAVAPGSIMAIFGTDLAAATQPAGSVPLPTVLMDTSVTFNNIPAPLFFVSKGQINIQVPFEIPPGPVSIQISRGSGSTMQPATIAQFSPGIFTLRQNGTGQGAILIANTAALAASPGVAPGSRPVNRGEYISIYGTGLGPVTNQPPTGTAPPVFCIPACDPSTVTTLPTITIGGISSQATFSGLAPGFVGLYSGKCAGATKCADGRCRTRSIEHWRNTVEYSHHRYSIGFAPASEEYAPMLRLGPPGNQIRRSCENVIRQDLRRHSQRPARGGISSTNTLPPLFLSWLELLCTTRVWFGCN